jgi:hypothetical protein
MSLQNWNDRRNTLVGNPSQRQRQRKLMGNFHQMSKSKTKAKEVNRQFPPDVQVKKGFT